MGREEGHVVAGHEGERLLTDREEERLARVALSRLGEPGDVRMGRLVTEIGPLALHRALLEQRDLEGLAADVAGRLAGLDPARELERAERVGVRFVIPGDEEWPEELDALAGAGDIDDRGGVPIGLWVRSRRRLDELAPRLAVVGSRSCTSYGETVAAEVAATGAAAGLTIVSGGAFGIDHAAHRGALSVRGDTVVVLACGADRVYPAHHRRLIDHVAEHGAVVSEAPPGCAPTRVRFLARNRLIAALAVGTVVVEAAARSGALSTARWTGRLHRPLMGVPGPVTSAASVGVHDQIRTGAAVLVTSGSDVLELVGRPGEHLVPPVRGPDRQRDRLTVRHRQVLDALPSGRPAGADSVARVAGIGVREVWTALRHLERLGLAETDGRGWKVVGDARA